MLRKISFERGTRERAHRDGDERWRAGEGERRNVEGSLSQAEWIPL